MQWEGLRTVPASLREPSHKTVSFCLMKTGCLESINEGKEDSETEVCSWTDCEMNHFLVCFSKMSSASLSPSLDLCFLERRLLSSLVGYPSVLLLQVFTLRA